LAQELTASISMGIKVLKLFWAFIIAVNPRIKKKNVKRLFFRGII
jgi:hypothetical protein